MKTVLTLPNGYKKLCDIDLKRNRKLFFFINGISIAVFIALSVLGVFFGPSVLLLFNLDNPILYFAKFLTLIVGMFAYILLHELVHGIFMRLFGSGKVHYGISATYAYAGSAAYFDKPHYIVIALAPVVLWGIVLAILCKVLPDEWFWVPYFIEVCNIGGAVGDFYVTGKMLGMASDILIQDTGVSMTVFSK